MLLYNLHFLFRDDADENEGNHIISDVSKMIQIADTFTILETSLARRGGRRGPCRGPVDPGGRSGIQMWHSL